MSAHCSQPLCSINLLAREERGEGGAEARGRQKEGQEREGGSCKGSFTAETQRAATGSCPLVQGKVASHRK